MRLIDADAAYARAQVDSRRGILEDWEFDVISNLLDSAPTVDAAPVVHGRWEFLGPNRLIKGCLCGTCSACKVRSKYIETPALCPNCGAKMDRGDPNGR